MTFITSNSSQYPLKIGYNDKYIELSVHTKFLGSHIDIHLHWKCHIEQLVSKLSEASYTVKSMLHISNTDTLKSIYFAYIHSTIKYGIIFWVNSCNSMWEPPTMNHVL
jgi:hypothetical protein